MIEIVSYLTGEKKEAYKYYEDVAPQIENLQLMKLEQNKKNDPLTHKIFYDSQYDDSQLSCRSEASFDSNFSDGFPMEQKKTETKIKELKK